MQKTPFNLLQSDIEAISAWVIGQLASKRIDLNESARKVMISKAIGQFIQYGKDAMEESITWEINLLSKLPRPNDRKIIVCVDQDMRNFQRIVKYLESIGCSLLKTAHTYYTIVPKTYSVCDVRKHLGDILKGME